MGPQINYSRSFGKSLWYHNSNPNLIKLTPQFFNFSLERFFFVTVIGEDFFKGGLPLVGH